ncbi:hypothetical protein [Wenxinia marina]|uniref:Uncharacterized protein n=1 Tax=Wenxinia marina DSM 24838 TaxID=1123501 RepID=A0A0D0Q731_9RHOB|nr:hypothetical protein [Wenxinia marina]KIQ70199.1 hypothetical protein Wenmar_01158 [Wenxinia marina DSM 24838]GGL50643.1 hypothetical protein GCM10011392_00980 [Wenxinia marina]
MAAITAEKRIIELEAALADYAHRYGMTDEARRLLVKDPFHRVQLETKRPDDEHV